MKDLSRLSFVKKSVAGGLIAANLTVFSGIIRANGGGGGTTTGEGTETGMTTDPNVYTTMIPNDSCSEEEMDAADNGGNYVASYETDTAGKDTKCGYPLNCNGKSCDKTWECEEWHPGSPLTCKDIMIVP